MANEPDVQFSNKLGGLNPPGTYCYPVGFGGSTEDNPVCRDIPYPYVPGSTLPGPNPGDMNDETE